MDTALKGEWRKFVYVYTYIKVQPLSHKLKYQGHRQLRGILKKYVPIDYKEDVEIFTTIC